MSDQKQLVFVYGTLKRGHVNNFYLRDDADATFLGTGVTKRAFVVCPGPSYPRLADPVECHRLAAAKKGFVEGELYAVGGNTLTALDRLEGVPHLYRRQRTEVVKDDGSTIEAFVYIIQDPRFRKAMTPDDDGRIAWFGIDIVRVADAQTGGRPLTKKLLYECQEQAYLANIGADVDDGHSEDSATESRGSNQAWVREQVKGRRY